MATPKKGGSKDGNGGRKKRTSTRPAPNQGPNQGLNRPVQPSADLAAVIGGDAVPRTEITKRVWEYIRNNGLQDSQNRRMINADAKLRKVFGGKDQVSMFEMTKLVNQHLK
ncbi:MAG TPA: SWIB/MDM2 domain-containing protein [Longimicrobiaceae bacterium]|nr:SWIB/MDM2 domain-containing protein [Longimicrobiaceae bacterium]